MDANTTFKLWYGEGKQDTTPSVAKDAFKAVQQHFEQSTILTKKEKRLLREGACIEEVLNEVSTSLEKYELRTQSSKTRKWLQKSSEIICHYGNVLDVFVQHHPEYVSLVWGTMKLLFTSVVNHAETLKLVAKSIWQVGVRLPRIKIASVLYSTSQIRAAVENLYSCILEFLLLAHAWCTESRLRHIIHSFTRPPKLQYEDVLQRISTGADNIMELATLGSQAEIRVMHTTQSGKLEEIISQLKDTDQTYKGQVDGLTHVVSGLRVSTEEYGKKLDAIMILVEASGMTINDLMAKVETFQAIQTSAQLNTNHQIEELNLSQILTSLSPKFEDPETCYKYHVFSRNRRISGRGRNTSTNQFWLSPKLTEWSSSSTSSLIILKGPFSVREALRDFGVDVLQTLKTAGVPTLWALPGLGNSRQNAMATASELMKYLTYQALRLAGSLRTEKQLSCRYSQFHTAREPRQWIELFVQVLQSLGKQVYVVVDLATAISSLDKADGFDLIRELRSMIGGMSKQGEIRVKIVLLMYEMDWFRALPREISASAVIVKSMKSKGPQGKGRTRAVNLRFGRR